MSFKDALMNSNTNLAQHIAKEQKKDKSTWGERIHIANLNLRTVERLQRSMIIETSCPSKSEERLHMTEWWNLEVEYIRDMEKYMFIASFKNQAHFEHAMQSLTTSLDSTCVKVRKWSMKEECRARCIWIEIFGIPTYA